MISGGLVLKRRFAAQCAEVAAPPGLRKVRDALALYVSFTCLFACLEVFDFSGRLRAVYLTGARVTGGIGREFHPGEYCSGNGGIKKDHLGCVSVM